MSYQNIKEVISYTGLKYSYIRKALNEFPDLFEPFIRRGDNNSILFDPNAVAILDKIKQLKSERMSLPSMGEELGVYQEKSPPKSPLTPMQTKPETDLVTILFNELKESNHRALEAKDEVLKSKNSQIQTLKEQMLLLTEGKSPEEKMRELEAQRESINKKDQRISTLEAEKREKEAQILKKQEEIAQKEQNISKEQESKKKLSELLATQKELYDKERSINASWSFGKKKKLSAVQKELSELEASIKELL